MKKNLIHNEYLFSQQIRKEIVGVTNEIEAIENIELDKLA